MSRPSLRPILNRMATGPGPEPAQPALQRVDERSAGVQRLLSQFRPRLAERMPRSELRAEAIVAVAFLLAAVPAGGPGARPRKPLAGGGAAVRGAATGRCRRSSSTSGPATACRPSSFWSRCSTRCRLGGCRCWSRQASRGNAPLDCPRNTQPGPDRPGRRRLRGTPSAPRSCSRSPGSPRRVGQTGAVLLAALAAQLACDLAATVAREWLRLGELPVLPVRLLGSV